MKLPNPSLDWSMTPFGIFRDPEFRRQGRWILTSALIGMVAGIGAILFDIMYRFSQHLFLEGLAGYRPTAPGAEGGAGFGPASIWMLPVSLVLGGLIVGVIIHYLAPETEGHGTDAVIEAFHHQRGRIRRRVPFIKALTAAICIGSGGSAGREGPTAQIGAGFGSWLGDVLDVRDRNRRILMLAGVAGGLGAIFRAPLGGAFFAAEVLYSEAEFEYEALLPGLIAAICGYSLYSSYAGWGFLFTVPPISFHSPTHLVGYAVLAILCAMAGRVFPPIFYGMRDRVFRKLKAPPWSKPAIGGAVLGAIALVYPQALGTGYGYIQEAIDGGHTVTFLLTLAALKMLATSLTLSSGGSGGVFGPSLVIGGAIGGAFGILAGEYFPPDLVPGPVPCIMVGMCGFFAGVAKTPLAAVIMVMEMTGSYGLLVPCLLVATVAYLAIPIGVSLYEKQVKARIDSPAHTGSFAVESLKRGLVGTACRGVGDGIVCLTAGTTLEAIVRIAMEGQQAVYPVTNGDGRLLGEVTLEDIRLATVEEAPRNLIVAQDLMRRVEAPLLPGDDLAQAARRLAMSGNDAVVVIADEDSRRVLGVLSRRDLILAYTATTSDDPAAAG